MMHRQNTINPWAHLYFTILKYCTIENLCAYMLFVPSARLCNAVDTVMSLLYILSYHQPCLSRERQMFSTQHPLELVTEFELLSLRSPDSLHHSAQEENIKIRL